MPVIRPADAAIEQVGPDNPLGISTAVLLSDAGGLSQFGAFTETLTPGARSSIRHWHASEDEFIYLLSGHITVHEGDSEVVMFPGDVACFKAGVPVGHFIENHTESDATYLVVGTRAAKDVVTCPDHRRRLTLDRTTGARQWTDLDGAPKPDPEVPDP
jgi:uncharacterized cupin superfamily protein